VWHFHTSKLNVWHWVSFLSASYRTSIYVSSVLCTKGLRRHKLRLISTLLTRTGVTFEIYDRRDQPGEASSSTHQSDGLGVWRNMAVMMIFRQQRLLVTFYW
jgi:hypothetical protein